MIAVLTVLMVAMVVMNLSSLLEAYANRDYGWAMVLAMVFLSLAGASLGWIFVWGIL